MARTLRLKRGTTAQNAAYTGAEGEVTYDTQAKALIIHDGITTGGLPISGGFDPISADVTVTVPTDYATLDLALAWAKQQVVTNGATVTIEVADTYTITTGIDLSGFNAPWLNIAFDNVTGVALDGTAFPLHPIFGQKIFLFMLYGVIGKISGKILPTNITDVQLGFLLFSDIDFGDSFLGSGFDAGGVWGGGIAISETRSSSSSITYTAADTPLGISGASSNVHIQNGAITSTAVGAGDSAITVDLGTLSLGAISITAPLRAISVSAGELFLKGTSVSGQVIAGTSGRISGYISHLSTPTGALPNTDIFFVSQGGEIDLGIQESLTLSAPNLTCRLASASYLGIAKVLLVPAATGVSTGAPAYVATGGTVELAGVSIATAFTGAVASPVGQITADGLIRVDDPAYNVAYYTQCIPVVCSDETTALTAGAGKVTFRMPYAFTLQEVRASLTTAQASGSIFTVDINDGISSVLSTKLTIDNTEKTSTTAAIPAVISDTALADDTEITIDIDQIGDGTAKGLKVYLIGVKV